MVRTPYLTPATQLLLPPLGGEGRGGGRIAHRLPQQATLQRRPPSLTLPAEGREPEQRTQTKAALLTLALSPRCIHLPKDRRGARGQEPAPINS